MRRENRSRHGAFVDVRKATTAKKAQRSYVDEARRRLGLQSRDKAFRQPPNKSTDSKVNNRFAKKRDFSSRNRASWSTGTFQSINLTKGYSTAAICRRPTWDEWDFYRATRLSSTLHSNNTRNANAKQVYRNPVKHVQHINDRQSSQHTLPKKAYFFQTTPKAPPIITQTNSVRRSFLSLNKKTKGRKTEEQQKKQQDFSLTLFEKLKLHAAGKKRDGTHYSLYNNIWEGVSLRRSFYKGSFRISRPTRGARLATDLLSILQS